LLPNCKHNCKFCNQKHKCNEGYVFESINTLTTAPKKIPKCFNWAGEGVEYFKLTDKIILKMNDWLAFLGLYLAEGCCLLRNDRISYELIIYQNHNKDSDKYIKNIIDKLPFNYTYHKRGWSVYSKDLIAYLKILGKSKEKYIPKELKNLTKEQLHILLDSLMFGDGSKDKKGNSFYFTISKQLADDVQEIAYKCGYIAGLYKRKGRICKISPSPKIGQTSYNVYFRKNNKQGNLNYIISGNLVFKNKIKDIEYNGNIYDLTVNNHTMWVRRNNICVWSGNCGYDWSRRPPNEVDLKNYNPDCNFDLHYYGDNVIHEGNHKIGYYERHLPDREFESFMKQKTKIYNVSLNSNINIFEKISYEHMFNLLNNETYNQDELRNKIKEKLCIV
jgi:hypothetical protein